MASSEGMETYAARLASFDKAHPTTKKRSSNAKGAKTLKWPHKTPAPAQLAKAGFFYQPTTSSPDNVICFICERALDGWEEDDDPIKEHLSYSADCGWIVNVGIEQDIEYGSFEEEDPMSTKMIEARRSTFAGLWPHESKRGWTCKTQKMVEAGWYYCPTAESDDFVKCPYCSLSLDGWEPKDNPYNEHQRRSPECAFFNLTQSLKPARAKKGRPSKASRMSTQSNITAENLSMIEVRMDEGDSILTTATNVSMSSTAPKTNKKGAKAKKGKGKAQNAGDTIEPTEVTQMSGFVEPEDDNFAVKIEPPKISKGKRGKKRTSEEMNAEEVHVTERPESSPPPAKRRTTRTRSSTVKPIHLPEPSNRNGDNSDVQMTDAETMPPPSIPKSKKGGKSGIKRASSTARKASNTSTVRKASNTSTARKASNTSTARKASNTSTARKASNTSTASKASLRSVIPADDEIDAALEADLDRPLTDEEDVGMDIDLEDRPKTRRLTRTKPGSMNASASIAPVKSKVARKPAPPRKKVTEQINHSNDQTQQDDVVTIAVPKDAASPTASTKTQNREPSPQLSERSIQASVLSAAPAPIEPATDKTQTPKPTKQAVPSPTPSPQSSNAENAPPSSLPSQRRPPLAQLSPSKTQTIRIPLAASTPTASPSKRNTASKLETTCAWTSVDIENIFLGSPSPNGKSARLFDESQIVLTSPEKRMTVEGWIMHNAKQAEERLRSECERLVGMFEGEGVRALRALEGIVCIE